MSADNGVVEQATDHRRVRHVKHELRKKILHDVDNAGSSLSEGKSGALYLGGGKYKIGDEVIVLEGSQADVLEALVKARAATKSDLINCSGVANAHTVLSGIQKNHPLLARLITLPGRKAKGGYRTRIEDTTT